MIVAWAIPDVPRKIRDQIKREEYLTREIIIREERHRMEVTAEGISVTVTEPPTDTPPANNNTSDNVNPIMYPLVEGGDNNFRRRKQNGDIEIENTILWRTILQEKRWIDVWIARTNFYPNNIETVLKLNYIESFTIF